MINTLTKNIYLPISSPTKKIFKGKRINKDNPSFSGMISPAKIEKLYKSKSLHKILEFIADKQLIFDASFALLLTCAFRPISIILLPSKKNKDDQKYAAAHSIASGIIGFTISNIIFTPISNAIKKIQNNPEKFIKGSNIDHLIEMKDGTKTLKFIPNAYMDRLPDIAGSIPKGILTIALIPPILRYVFGMGNKKSSENKLQNQNPKHITKGGLK